jgi:hypothetical protein
VSAADAKKMGLKVTEVPKTVSKPDKKPVVTGEKKSAVVAKVKAVG